jgi:3'-phosphoadenosine 5'-phosphosulfate sulfotransferase (PAPS reductase)/FAD synthetase
MTMENDLLLKNDDEGRDGMLPTTSCSLPSSSGISSLLAVAFGGGTNSTAMLCGFRERGIKPDLILFADTGGELPETYEHVMEMDTQCRIWWGVGIETVKKTYQGGFEGLEGECIRGRKLPALAYGRKACSMKYKTQPQTQALKLFMDATGAKDAVRAIGYDAGENHRANDISGEDLKKGRYVRNWFPLLEWEWRRQECIEAIARHGLTQPGKSACWFCPAMKRGEILRLKRTRPDLFARALKIESNAILKSPGRGLGGQSLRWENVDTNDTAQGRLWDYLDEHDESPIPCGCYDG